MTHGIVGILLGIAFLLALLDWGLAARGDRSRILQDVAIMALSFAGLITIVQVPQ